MSAETNQKLFINNGSIEETVTPTTVRRAWGEVYLSPFFREDKYFLLLLSPLPPGSIIVLRAKIINALLAPNF